MIDKIAMALLVLVLFVIAMLFVALIGVLYGFQKGVDMERNGRFLFFDDDDEGDSEAGQDNSQNNGG